MKILFLPVFLCVLLFWAGCSRNDTANPVSPTEASLSFKTDVQYMNGGLRVTFIPNTDVTVAQVIVMEQTGWNPTTYAIDTVNLPDPTRVYSKGTLYYVDGYVARGYGIDGLTWKFVFSGLIEPVGTLYNCQSEFGVP